MASARDRKLASLRRKHAALEQRIGELMNLRVAVEDEMALLLEQGQTEVDLRSVRGMSQQQPEASDD